MNCYTVPDDLERGPHVHQICDREDPFLPAPLDALMLNLANDRAKIDLLLEKLPEIHTMENSKHKLAALNLSSAFHISYEMLENSGGRVLTFYSRIENVGPAINTVTESHKAYNTDAEKTFFKPNIGNYIDLAAKMFSKRITVDLFCGTYHNVSLPNPAKLSTQTGGDVYYYKSFSDRLDGEKLLYDVFRILTRNCAYDVAFRVR